MGTAETARLFAVLNVALADAAIVCWDGKFHYDLWRPVTAIREASGLIDLALPADRDWEPLLPTPPFPAYPSGHSTFSGAAAAALAELFGTDAIRFTSTSDGLPGVTRSFASFSAAAAEAGASRIYGGIHWDFDNSEGLMCGRKVGEFVARTVARPVSSGPTGVKPVASFAVRSRVVDR
jgi:membrane-associated phospholipid phosphatase